MIGLNVHFIVFAHLLLHISAKAPESPVVGFWDRHRSFDGAKSPGKSTENPVTTWDTVQLESDDGMSEDALRLQASHEQSHLLGNFMQSCVSCSPIQAAAGVAVLCAVGVGVYLVLRFH